MAFLVYEKDPFVRSDIFETLSSAFPECPVSELPGVDFLSEAASSDNRPTVAVLSARWSEVKSQIKELGKRAQNLHLILIDDEIPTDEDESSSFMFVQRPFSSDTLLEVVRIALSAPRSFR